jgi:hypothetical protein
MTDECTLLFLAPDYPGGRDEKHGCDKTGSHTVHHCICGATGTEIADNQEWCAP